MTTRRTTYPTEVAARDAVAALRNAGIPARHIWLLAGRRPGDLRREPVGGFAGHAMVLADLRDTTTSEAPERLEDIPPAA